MPAGKGEGLGCTDFFGSSSGQGEVHLIGVCSLGVVDGGVQCWLGGSPAPLRTRSKSTPLLDQ